MARLKNWPVALGQAVAVGLGGILAAALVSDAPLVVLAGAVVGLLMALFLEYIVRLHIDVRRLRDAPRQLEAERRLREEERRVWSYQLAGERRRLAVSEIGVKVYSGALSEVDPGGQRLPLPAIMARMQMYQQAQGLDKPMPPLDEWKAPPPGQPL